MRCSTLLCTIASVALLVPALALEATAGPYIGAGIGTEAAVTGDLGQRFNTEDRYHGRLVVGQRIGPVSIEASVLGTQLNVGRMETGNSVTAGFGLKYNLNLVARLDFYAKAGLNRSWLRSQPEGMKEYSPGNGWNVGAGLEFRLPLASLWLDFDRENISLAGEASEPNLHGTMNLITFGMSFGF